jgi:hypothetical protein
MKLTVLLMVHFLDEGQVWLMVHQSRFCRGRRHLSLLRPDGQRPMVFGLGPEPLLPDAGLLELDELDNDGQGQGEEGDCRHHGPNKYAKLSHGSVLNRSTWQG